QPDQKEREDEELQAAIQIIKDHGGQISIRDLTQSSRRFATAAAAEAVLEKLVAGQMGRWERLPPGAEGGRPSRIFKLNSVTGSTKEGEEETGERQPGEEEDGDGDGEEEVFEWSA